MICFERNFNYFYRLFSLYISDSQRGLGGSPMVHLQSLVVHRSSIDLDKTFTNLYAKQIRLIVHKVSA